MEQWSEVSAFSSCALAAPRPLTTASRFSQLPASVSKLRTEARKQGAGTGRIIAYVMTQNGPEPVGDLTAAPDYAHYIEHQIAPIADAVLRFLGTAFETIVQTKKQLSLF